MTLFQNKYRVEPARLTGYDYSTPGWYFITICTKNRVQYFGDIVSVETPDPGVSKTAIENHTPDPGVSKTPTSQSQIRLSEIGQIADKYWNEIHSHFPHVILDAYQIMPDHIHGIIQITAVETPDPGVSKTTNENQPPDPGVSKTTNENQPPDPGVSKIAIENQPPDPDVSNTAIENQPPDPVSITENRIETPDSGVSTRPSLGIIINQFKRICTIKIRNANLKFAWQPRFHDHIIRDDEELQRIKEYIRDNPKNWMNDKL